jgi:hypothetical protein
MRSTDKKAGDAFGAGLLVAAGLVSVVFGLTLLVRLSVTTPHVGDIVAFTPVEIAPMDDGTRLLVNRPNQFGCVLDMNVLRRLGGSVVIETQLGTGSFKAHWAGSRTSDDPGNCGGEADLIVNHVDMDVLALAAGGYGVGPRRSPVFPGAAGNETALGGRYSTTAY